ncbi:MAG: hypothetical protein WC635_14840 [Bacteriovorax sp.]|jgi:hypothetical protein
MKLLLAFLFSTNLFATDLNLGCVTEIPTTSLIAQTKDGVVEFNLIHHNGVKYMPIHNGVITPYDLETLSTRADILADLGDNLVFTMPASACQVDGVLFNCFGAQPAQNIGGHQVSIWAAYSSTYDDVSLIGIFPFVTTNLAIEVDGKSYYLPMRYNQAECFKDFKKSKLLKSITLTQNKR